MKHTHPIDRRTMLQASGSLLLASATSAPSFALPVAQQDVEKDLIFRTNDPRNAEPALPNLMKSWITPTKYFYVRSHATNPTIDPDAFRLKVEGLVDNELTLSLNDLKQFERHTTTATLTCAGNRRAEFNEEGKVGGVQWQAGAIGNATWGGVALAEVLRKAGVKEGAKHVWFEGLDEIEKGGGIIPFGGSIPIEKAMLAKGNGAPLLADQMNESALTADHGYPLRTVVPGYIGARSVKWLGKIVVSDRTSPNHYLATAYKIVKKTDAMDWSEAGPIYRYPINAAICTPADSNLSTGKLELSGYALPTGRPGSKIKQISVGVSGSKGTPKSWTKAKLGGEQNEFCWRHWSATVTINKGTKALFVRGMDSSGGFMPYRVPWNAKGYLQNSWYRLPVQPKDA